jgi:hypothetical protein
MAAFTHRQATGHDITADTLASHLAIPRDLAATLHHALGDNGIADSTPPPATNGSGILSGSRP